MITKIPFVTHFVIILAIFYWIIFLLHMDLWYDLYIWNINSLLLTFLHMSHFCLWLVILLFKWDHIITRNIPFYWDESNPLFYNLCAFIKKWVFFFVLIWGKIFFWCFKILLFHIWKNKLPELIFYMMWSRKHLCLFWSSFFFY